jgi:hypothetical protein
MIQNGLHLLLIVAFSVALFGACGATEDDLSTRHQALSGHHRRGGDLRHYRETTS